MGEQQTPKQASNLDANVYASAILDAVSVAKIGVCVTLDVEGIPRSVHVSDTALEILGRTRDDVMSRTLFEFIAPEELPRLKSIRDKRAAGEPVDSMIETVIVKADGTRAPVAYVLAEPPVAHGYGFVAFLWDISKRRAEEARFRSVIESAPDGIVISRNGEILDANPAAAKMLGRKHASDLVGVSLYALMSPVDTQAMNERVAASRSGAQLAPRVYEAKRADGTRVLAEITSVPCEHNGQPAVMGFARDVTYRAKLEAQLVQSERLVALGTLAAGVAHEVNNPLAVISLSLEELSMRLEGTLKKADVAEKRSVGSLLDGLRTGVDRVASIIRELRAFSRTDTEPPGPTNVLEALAAAERMTTHQLRHHTRVCTDYGVIPLALGHGQRLEQVFVNLLINASQALPEGRAENRIDVRAFVGTDSRVVVEIEDNGSGMDEATLARVFDPFFTTRTNSGGTGLGLSISHGLVTQLGGEIVLESVHGRGTVARVSLKPASSNESTFAGQRAPVGDVPARMRVLIVDDEPSLVTTLRMLIGEEHDVTTANSGDAACSILLSGRSFDVVLCDMMMPGVSGMDVYERVVNVYPEFNGRFVFMTGGACTDKAAAFLAQHPKAVLEKPFTSATLRRVIAGVGG